MKEDRANVPVTDEQAASAMERLRIVATRVLVWLSAVFLAAAAGYMWLASMGALR